MARVAGGPEFLHPNPTPWQLDDQVRGYERATGDMVRRQAQRNLIAACYRVHGADFLTLVREWFERTGTATNLLGELRVLLPREGRPVPAVAPDSSEVMEFDQPTQGNGSRRQIGESGVGRQAGCDQQNPADGDSAWCGCPEEELRPGLLYCASHRPGYLSAPKLRYDRRESNPAATRFFAATADQSGSGARRK